MEISFSPNGRESSNDIIVHNSWCAELEPLLKMLKEFAPHADDLPSKERMMPKRVYGYPPQEEVGEHAIRSIETWRAYPPLQTDWWIVWPKLFLKKPDVVLDLSPESRGW